VHPSVAQVHIIGEWLGPQVKALYDLDQRSPAGT
jgi:hypothetical protein